MDNFRFDVTCAGQRALKNVMQLAFTGEYPSMPKKVVGYALRKADAKNDVDRLVLYWTRNEPPSDIQYFPFAIDLDLAVSFVEGWLASTDYGEADDIDGDAKKGFRIYNEAWGHVDNDWQAFAAIVPAWAYYGK